MSKATDDLLKRPLYVFDLPPELLLTLHFQHSSLLQPQAAETLESQERNEENLRKIIHQDDDGPTKPSSASCVLCGAPSFPNVEEQRRHVKSDWHNYNLKQKLRNKKLVSELEFEKLVEDLDESLSGSDSSESDDNEDSKDSTLTALLKKQARIHQGSHQKDEEELTVPTKRKQRGSGKPPLVWFSSSLLPPNTSLGIYRTLFTTAELEEEEGKEANIMDQATGHQQQQQTLIFSSA
ncbi:MAG: hypothetical protein Q9190_006114 [Brigantiaea leucoxantha]